MNGGLKAWRYYAVAPPSKSRHAMLRAGQTGRFAPDEIEGYRRLGLDFDGARTPDGVERVLTRRADTMNDERPDLLYLIATALARARGIGLPARLKRERRAEL
jgi:hypothetical protein